MADGNSMRQRALALTAASVREDLDALRALVDDLDADGARDVVYGMSFALGMLLRSDAAGRGVPLDDVLDELRAMILAVAADRHE